jgi:hypothetical protein
MYVRMTTQQTQLKAETQSSTKEEGGPSTFIALKIKQQVYPWTPSAFHNNVTGWCNLSFQDQTVHSIGQGVMFCSFASKLIHFLAYGGFLSATMLWHAFNSIHVWGQQSKPPCNSTITEHGRWWWDWCVCFTDRWKLSRALSSPAVLTMLFLFASVFTAPIVSSKRIHARGIVWGDWQSVEVFILECMRGGVGYDSMRNIRSCPRYECRDNKEYVTCYALCVKLQYQDVIAW